MWTGKQTLDQINTGLGSVNAELVRIDAALQQLSQAVTDNRFQQAETITQLARIRLDEIQQGELIDQLGAADHTVVELLQQRTGQITRLENDLAEQTRLLQGLEEERRRQVDALDELSEQLIDAEHRVQTALEQDAPYQAQLAVARRADAIADEAEAKAKQAQIDRAAKGKPFENDRLFSYLWQRHYGTVDYRANPLIRFLDGWVADLCDYAQARPTYHTLLEIPQRLQQHAERVQEQASSEITRLEEMEREVAAETGLEQLQHQLKQLETQLTEQDGEMAASEDRCHQVRQALGTYRGGQDEYSRKCLATLSAAMERTDIDALKGTAYETRSTDDDRLIRTLEALRDDQQDLNRDLDETRQQHDRLLDRLKELEEVRRKFKEHRYDDLRSGFSNETLLASVLAQFVQGMISGSDLWGTMRRHQRHRDVGAWPDFGSGGLGRRRRRRGGAPWFNPGSGGGGFRLPRNGGFSSRGRGGGFRTGGSF